MNYLQRYIARTIIQSTFIVTTVFLSLYVFIAFLSEMEYIGKGDYQILQAFLYVLLILPDELYQYFPMASLMGSLMGLGMLASHSELIVMRAAGVSLSQIAWMVLKVAFVMIALVTAFGETIAPEAKHYAETQKVILTSGGRALKTEGGIWLRQGQEFIHIRSVDPGEHLQDVSRYRFDEQNRLESASFSHEAQHEDKQWMLYNTVQSDLSPTQVKTQHRLKFIWPIAFSPGLVAISAIQPSEMTLLQLYGYLKATKRGKLQAKSYELAFYKRLIQPLASAVMTLLALPFIFGPLRSASMGLRILAGISSGFAFYMMYQFFGPISIVYQIPPLVAAILPVLLFIGFGFWLMRKVG